MLAFNLFCGLLLWIHFVTFVECATDCTLQAFKEAHFYDENFEVANLKQSYNLGDSVRVPCKVGFTGFFRLICSDRGWSERGDKCRPISCGHPGDVPFADFKLVHGTDYVFGSQVQYTCHRGYQMTSYTSTRNCRQGGWDGHLPECEPVSCPSVTVDFNKVLVYGDLDQPTSGSVLQFSCNSRDDELVGPTQIVCGDNGNWDNNPPTCRAIICEKPPLDNFKVQGEKMVYKKDEVLRYTCNPRYKKVDGRPTVCKKVGQSAQWAPMPQCELITCKLDKLRGTTYDPLNQIIFEPGQTVIVTCGEKEWVRSKELQSAELTCQDTGDWDFEPVCKLVTCSRRGDYVYRWEYTGFNTVRIDETLSYQCYAGYVETSPTGRATCTRRDWEPSPLCKEIICEKPPLDNFEVDGEKTVYKKDEVLRYSCDYGYKKVDGRPSVCSKVGRSAQWTPMPQCEPITCELEKYTGDPQNRNFRPGQTVTVSCGEKHWVKSKELQSAELTCQDTGDWDFEPVCKVVTCSKTAENVYRWESTWYNTVNIDKSLWYQCSEDYKETSPTGRATCTRRGWEPSPLCTDGRCTKPSYRNAYIDNNEKDKYRHDEHVLIRCTHEPSVYFYVRCSYGNWTGSVRTCQERPCMTHPDIENGEMLGNKKTQYEGGETLQFRCKGETQTFSVTCQDGEWKKQQSCTVVPCTEQPNITNGEMVGRQKPPYQHGDTVRMRCTTGSMENFRVRCQSGEWSEHQCPDLPCTAQPDIKNGEMVGRQKQQYRHGATVEMRCTTGSKENFRVLCQSGKWSKHHCPENRVCGSADILNGFSHEHQNKLYYTCNDGFKLLTKGWWSEASCVEGEWNTLECVAKTDCGPVPDIPHLIERIERSESQPELFSDGDTFPLQCETGHRLHRDVLNLTCSGGTWTSKGVPFEEICTPIAIKCPPPPYVKDAVIKAPFQTEYPSNTTLTYNCRDNFTMEGNGIVQCNNGAWISEQKSIECKQKPLIPQ